ncbi:MULTISPECIES: hypothetical protein [Shewanella]|uniref:PH domain-containing protein n=1 Tax=Shewanella marisflavi TaxID=260364 RepID=A0AAC9XPL8_9GAMM|nr:MULTISPECIES: hypothetical protein [Shewanella]ASJ98002.1 hypothetical protein CFF01_16175 [Shewanella marisflavi]MCL1040178.1 hypothetical protein [Shewanella marisflavi]QDF76573.1 hypothetical protein FGA12_16170 [Shewanella marisflavi]
MQYKNTQPGIAMLSIMGIVVLVLVFASVTKPTEPIGFAYLILGVLSILFSSLTIKVEGGEVKWFFGPKFWNKSIKISEIESIKKTRTKWYYGLGIRLISTGWLYNVSGLTAVELKLKDGTTVSLGTNDPENLIKAIEQSS